MADERDPGVSGRYRELGAEEPPRRLDDAILAASRRRWRWAAPVAAAAVIVLAVAVTVHVERDRPDPESAALMRAPAPAQELAKEQKQTEESHADTTLRQKREVQPAAPAPAPAEKALAPDPPRAARDQADMAASREEPRMRESAPIAGARAPEAARTDRIASRLVEPPEKMLERIAELRRQGKHEEADKALEAFRKRYPEYKIPEAALKP